MKAREIQREIDVRGLRRDAVADAMGVHKSSITRALRDPEKDLTLDFSSRILRAIDDLAAGKRRTA